MDNLSPTIGKSSTSNGFFGMLSDLCIKEKKQAEEQITGKIENKTKSGKPINILEEEEEFKTKFTNLFVIKQVTSEGDKLLKEAKVLKGFNIIL
jgi:hypothetical protein